jgi:acyl-CoA thioesterase-1
MNTIMDKLRNKKPVTIAFLGDSVTQGCFELRLADGKNIEPVYRPWEAYSKKLQKIFEYCITDTSINVLNYGISGDTAAMGLARMDEMLLHKPDAVIVCFGLNDSTKDMDGINEYKESLKEIFKKLQGVQTIFMTPNATNSSVDKFETNVDIIRIMEETAKRQNGGIMDAYIECACKVCGEYNVPVCDCYKIWKDMEKSGIDILNLLSNKINHPTEELHWLFAYELFKTIIKM